jgi:enoyl-CoA hydratase/carnithine racemase
LHDEARALDKKERPDFVHVRDMRRNVRLAGLGDAKAIHAARDAAIEALPRPVRRKRFAPFDLAIRALSSAWYLFSSDLTSHWKYRNPQRWRHCSISGGFPYCRCRKVRKVVEVKLTNPDILSIQTKDGIVVVTLGSPRRIFIDAEMSDALLEALIMFANDDAVRVVVVTGGAPGYFARHYSVAELVKIGEQLRSSGQKPALETPYKPGSFADAMQAAEQMPKPVTAAISGSAMGGAFELALACDIRIAQIGDFQIGLPEVNLGILPGGGGTQRLPRVIGTAAALLHVLMGVTLSPAEAAQKGLVHEAVPGDALDRAMEIARRLATHTPESVRHIKRLVRSALDNSLDEGLQLERKFFMDLCGSKEAITRMSAYEDMHITDPFQQVRTR